MTTTEPALRPAYDVMLRIYPPPQPNAPSKPHSESLTAMRSRGLAGWPGQGGEAWRGL